MRTASRAAAASCCLVDPRSLCSEKSTAAWSASGSDHESNRFSSSAASSDPWMDEEETFMWRAGQLVDLLQSMELHTIFESELEDESDDDSDVAQSTGTLLSRGAQGAPEPHLERHEVRRKSSPSPAPLRPHARVMMTL